MYQKLNGMYQKLTIMYLVLRWFVEVPRLGLTTFTPLSAFLVFLNTGTMTLQHFLALSILAAISPVSHSIVNSCKRVVVITVSVLYFGNPVSVLNAAGIVVVNFLLSILPPLIVPSDWLLVV